MKRLIFVIFSFIPVLLLAQGLFESAILDEEESSEFSSFAVSSVGAASTKLDFNGFTRASVMSGNENYQISNTFAEATFQTSLKHNEAMLKSDIRLRKGLAFNEDYQDIEIKELYTGYSSNKLDVLGGYQLVNWGRTDGFNPTNHINPVDYFFLTADPNDQIMSNLMMRLKYRFSSSVDIDLVGIPFYKPSNYRFDLFEIKDMIDFKDMGLPTLPLDINLDFNPVKLPERKLSNSSFGARLNFELPQIGFAVSYFSGYDPYHGFDVDTLHLDMPDLSNMPDLSTIPGLPDLSGIVDWSEVNDWSDLEALGDLLALIDWSDLAGFVDLEDILALIGDADPLAIQMELTPKVYKKHSLGVDFELPLNGFIFKGELAMNFVSQKPKDAIYVPKNDVFYVFALEKMWNDYVFIAQLIGRNVIDFDDLKEPKIDNFDITKLREYAKDRVRYESEKFNRLIFNQKDEQNYAAAFTVTKSFAYDVWNAQLTGYYNFTNKEFMIRPQVSWKVNDYLTLNVGANYMHAYNSTLFKYSSKIMNGVFAEVKVHF